MPTEPLHDVWTPPERFDGFVLDSLLGQGGMGRVYLAHEELLERKVAIKFVLSATPKARERFLTEARAVARLGHANIVAIYRIGEVDGQPYVAYEYVPGRNLDEHPRPAPWPDVLRIGLGISRALAAAHARGVLHRDVKPANILESETGEVKLVDFGLAKLDRSEDGSEDEAPESVSPLSDVSKTAPGVLAGTPLYIAPELWLGEAATPASDVFAAGLVLYELATGAIPHADGTPLEIARAVISRDLPTIPSVRSEFPLSLGRVIERAIQRRAVARFASAGELLEALESLDAVLSRFRGLGSTRPEGVDDAARVVASLGRIAPHSDQLYVSVYEQLFSRQPALRALFPADMAPQRAKLASALELIVQHLRHPEHIVALLEELGQRHLHYGATAEHLTVLGESLLVGLELHDPMPWDDATRDAWRAAYASIAQGMQRGLHSGTVTKPDLSDVTRSGLQSA